MSEHLTKKGWMIISLVIYIAHKKSRFLCAKKEEEERDRSA